MIEIKNTLWDDIHFGIKTGRVIIEENLSVETIRKLKEDALQYDLVVIENKDNYICNDQLLAGIRSNYLCDIFVNLKLECTRLEGKKDTQVKIYSNFAGNDEILNMSRKVYIYSRFINDPFLDKDKAREVYVEWCKGTFNRKDKIYLVYKEADKIEGYILFGEVEDYLEIELIATSPDKQHKGIGKIMFGSLLAYCYENQIKQIHLGTQMYNKPAIHFYQKQGFTIETCKTIYHYWPKK